MVNYCYNPGCMRELHYLRDGRVVRIIHGDGDDMRVEHFWLCGDCSQTHDFVFGADGSVSLRDRRKAATPAASSEISISVGS